MYEICCQSQGDRVCDTPPHRRVCNGCTDEFSNLCDNGSSSSLFINNYMNYSGPECLNEFTQGQVSRMQQNLNSTRKRLLISLGCQEPCGSVIAYFEAPEIIDENETVYFENEDPYLSSWYIDGVLYSNNVMFSYQFENSGVFEVCLLADDESCQDLYCKDIYVNVIVNDAACSDYILDECEIILNGDFDQTVPFEEIIFNVDYPAYHLGFGTIPLEEDYPICNWAAYMATPHFCVEDLDAGSSSNKWALGISGGSLEDFVLSSVEGISTISTLGLVDGELYEVKLEMGAGAASEDVNLPLGGNMQIKAVVGLSESVFLEDNSEYFLEDNIVMQVEISDDFERCNAETTTEVEFDFIYDEPTMKGQHLFIRPISLIGTGIAWLTVDNVSVTRCEPCSTDFIYTVNNCEFNFEPVVFNEASSCSWDFGDGSMSVDCNSTHIYNSSGTYLVCLNQLCSDGLWTQSCNEIVVSIPEEPLTACWETATFDNDNCEWNVTGEELLLSINPFEDIEFCSGLDEQITATVTGGTPPYTYEWSYFANWNDTDLTNVSTTNSTFDLSGTASVPENFEDAELKVTVTDDNGCTNTQTVQYDVLSNPTILSIDTEPSDCNDNGEICITFSDHTRTVIKFSIDGGMTWTQIDIDDNLPEYCFADLPSGSYPIQTQWWGGNCTQVWADEIVEDVCDPILFANCSDGDYEADLYIEGTNNHISSLNLGSFVSEMTIYIDEELTIDQPMTFSNCTLLFGENARLVVNSETNLFAGSLLTACDYIWDGVILNGESLRVVGSTIENAKIGISVTNEGFSSLDRGSQVSNCEVGVELDHSRLSMSKESKIQCEDRISEYDFVSGIISTGGSSIVNLKNSFIHDISQAISITGDAGNYSTLTINNNSEIYNNGDFLNITNPWALGVSQFSVFSDFASVIIESSDIFNTGGCIRARNSILDISKCKKMEAQIFGIHATNCMLAVYDKNVISSHWICIYGSKLKSLDISKNDLKVDNAGSAIYIKETYLNALSSKIFNNNITLDGGTFGIKTTEVPNINIVENEIEFNNLGSVFDEGIRVEGGSFHEIRCNEIKSSDAQPIQAGIDIREASNCQIIENSLDFCVRGLQFLENSSMHTIKGNQFVSGITGINTNSMLGPQPPLGPETTVDQQYHGNIWQREAWNREAVSSLASGQNEFMAFTVNPLISDWSCDNDIPSGYVYNPPNVSDNWFFSDDEYCNQQYGACLYEPSGPDFPDGFSLLDALESICNSIADGKKDGVDCSESWVSSFELFSLIKNMEVSPSKEEHDCLSDFIAETDSTLLQSFFEIDSILYSGLDSTSLVTIDSLYTDLYDHIDEHGYDAVDSLFSDIVTFTIARDSLNAIKSMQIDSILLDVIPDSCAVTQAFQDVYTFMNAGISIDSLSKDIGNQQMLHSIALECPNRFGHVVYVARSYMRLVSDYDYENNDCDVRETDKRELLSQPKAKSIQMYPNPTRTSITVEARHIRAGTIEIFDVSLRKVKQIQDFSQIMSIKLDELDPGIYFVKIIDTIHSTHEVKKIIIQ